MKIQISIECNDDDDALSHLSVIRSQLKKRLANQFDSDETPIELKDSNCYGSHEVKVTF